MKKISDVFLVLGISLFSTSLLQAEALLSPLCQPFEITEAPSIPEHFNQGLLFKVEKDGVPASYVFGTMHVGDADIVNLPSEVDSIFESSDRYVMEVTHSQSELMAVTQTMFYQDGTQLSSIVDPVIFNRLVELLAPYGVNEATANIFKPWSAFLTISYPPPSGLPLDTVLAERAKAAGKQVHGLESMAEQMSIFMNIKQSEQIEMLNATVCHFDKFQEMLTEIKTLYLQQDIGNLYAQGQRHDPNDKQAFDELMDNLLTKRNVKMVRRMQSLLQAGNSFIAVGALHLPAKNGVLYLLQQQGYTVTKVY